MSRTAGQGEKPRSDNGLPADRRDGGQPRCTISVRRSRDRAPRGGGRAQPPPATLLPRRGMANRAASRRTMIRWLRVKAGTLCVCGPQRAPAKSMVFLRIAPLVDPQTGQTFHASAGHFSIDFHIRLMHQCRIGTPLVGRPQVRRGNSLRRVGRPAWM